MFSPIRNFLWDHRNNCEHLPIDRCRNLSYFKYLQIIRKELEYIVPYFPLQGCRIASRVVSTLLNLEELQGMYQSDIPLYISGHAWNFDQKKGLYVDLSQDQFEREAPKVSILPKTTKKLAMNEDVTNTLRAIKTKHVTDRVDLEEVIESLKVKMLL